MPHVTEKKIPRVPQSFIVALHGQYQIKKHYEEQKV